MTTDLETPATSKRPVSAEDLDHARAARLAECLPKFERFVDFFCRLVKQPAPLAAADCKQGHKDYFPEYYKRLFGPGVHRVATRHLKWLHRLQPVLALPKGTRIADIGGGYGLDSILLSYLGYDVLFFEISPHHIAIAKELVRLWEAELEPLSIDTALGQPLFGRGENVEQNAELLRGVEAHLYHEVAHHIEPGSNVFALSAAALAPGGRMFLLEPNYWNPHVQALFFMVRGFKTVIRMKNEETGLEYDYGNEHIRPYGSWVALAREAGLRLRSAEFIVPYLLRSAAGLESRGRKLLETTPGLRTFAATHITFEFERLRE